jgi:hypothetical protein
MNFKVNNRQLLLLAGIVWIVAGANILRIGILTWLTDAHCWLFKAGEATIVFLIFFNLIFKKLYNKHTDRICKKANNNHLLSFFDLKGWIIMFFMITLGVTVRKFQLLPNSFISVFYTGLSTALIITGILFFRKGINYAQS